MSPTVQQIVNGFARGPLDSGKPARFIVREVRGMCLGSGGFIVRDTHDGWQTTPFTWREDAERCARILQRQADAEETQGEAA